MNSSDVHLPAFHARLVRRSAEKRLMRLRDGMDDPDDAEDALGLLLLAQLLSAKRTAGGA